MYKYLFLVFIVIFAGCSNKAWTLDGKIIKENNIQEEHFSSKKYVNISKDAIFEATKKVFILAGKKEFRIDSYRDKLIISKTKMNYYPLFPISHEDFWILYIDEENNISNAKLELFRITNFDKDNIQYLDSDVHNILWNRIEYILGLNDKWESCTKYWDFNDVLCDSIDLNSFKEAKKEDIVKKILISDRKKSKSLNKINEDILRDDIELSIDDSTNDILSKGNSIENEETKSEESLNNSIDKEIEKLDKKVNENIDNTLDKINDEIVNKENEVLE